MDMNQQVGQRSFEYPGQIVAARETHRDRSENQHSHAGEKEKRSELSAHASHVARETVALARSVVQLSRNATIGSTLAARRAGM
jgi:hypothetical protein